MPTTVTSKGQVTIPRKVRDLLGITHGSAVTFALNPAGEVVLRHTRRKDRRKASRFARMRGAATVRMTTDEIVAAYPGPVRRV